MPNTVVDGRKLYYELHGDHPGPPLLLANGAGGSCRGWLPLQVPELSRVRPTLIFDYPGVGESEPYPGPFTTADLADTTAGLLDALDLAQSDVLGVFMGGMVAQQLALRHPERTRRLVLVGTYGRPDAKRRALLTQWRALAESGASVEIQVRNRLLWTVQDDTMEQGDLIDAMLEFYTRESPPMSAETFGLQCAACMDHDVLDRLREIAVPVLVICGRHDQFTPPKLHRELADELPDARLVTFHHAAHVVMLEAAEPFNQTVLDFLSE